jgi:hypothetical protein
MLATPAMSKFLLTKKLRTDGFEENDPEGVAFEYGVLE